MAMNFGKNNRSVAFNPTSAFPLDARSYFESLEAARAAAATAEEAGSSNTIYYYGQTIVVVENNLAKLYIIQPDKSLVLISGSSANSLKRYPIQSVELLESYIANNEDVYNYIFVVPNQSNGDNRYDEYIAVDLYDAVGTKTGTVPERIGSLDANINLQDYAKLDDLKNYATKEEAELNLINSHSADFEVDDNRQLKLSQSFLQNLSASLEAKYSKNDGELISTEQKTKLDNLLTITDVSNDFNINTSGVLSLKTSIADVASYLNRTETLENKVSGIEDFINNNLTWQKI